MKKENAVTLVALVITIIILLILAAVAIAQLSDSGLFKKSQESKQKWEVAQADEDEKIAKYTNEIDNYIKNTRENSFLSIDENEHEIGNFFGQKLYQKGFIAKTPSSQSALLDQSNNVINLSNLNIDKCINIYGCIKNSAGYIPLNFSQAGEYVSLYYNETSKDLQLRCTNGYYNCTGYVIIEYTKTN